MALQATIYKASVNIADMDRNYYGAHSLTLACHPSEILVRSGIPADRTEFVGLSALRARWQRWRVA